MIIFISYNDIYNQSHWVKYDVDYIMTSVSNFNTKILYVWSNYFNPVKRSSRIGAIVPCEGVDLHSTVSRLFFNNRLYCINDVHELDECCDEIRLQLNNEQMEKILDSV